MSTGPVRLTKEALHGLPTPIPPVNVLCWLSASAGVAAKGANNATLITAMTRRQTPIIVFIVFPFALTGAKHLDHVHDCLRGVRKLMAACAKVRLYTSCMTVE